MYACLYTHIYDCTETSGISSTLNVDYAMDTYVSRKCVKINRTANQQNKLLPTIGGGGENHSEAKAETRSCTDAFNHKTSNYFGNTVNRMHSVRRL